MCSRFYIKKDFIKKLDRILKQEGITPISKEYCSDPADITDVRPSESAITLIGRSPQDIMISQMLWGYRNPYDKGLIINARQETVHEKRMFQEGIANRRCIVPASGFYEWDRNKARYTFTSTGDGLILMAGIYRPEPDKPHFVILTTEANSTMAPVHDRMPVIIKEDEIRPWLTDHLRTDDLMDRPQAELTREQDQGQISMFF